MAEPSPMPTDRTGHDAQPMSVEPASGVPEADSAGSSESVARAAAPIIPVGGEERLESLDVLRGFALLGILAMNIMAFSGPFAGYADPTIWPTPYAGGNRYAYWLTHTLFDLKMMSLFSMLFGAGVVVWGAKAKTPGEIARVRWLWLRRMGWLFVIGMAHAWLLWEGDILVAYALCGAMVVWWVRRLPIAALVAIATVLFLVHIALALVLAGFTWLAMTEHATPPFGMSQADLDSMRQGMAAFLAPTPEMLRQDVSTHRGSYLDILPVRAAANAFIQTSIFGMYVFWRSSAMMLLGIVLMRTGVLSGRRSKRFYAIMAGACYGVGLPLVIGTIIDNERHGFDPARTALVGGMLNLVGSVPVALGHAALLLLVVKTGALPLIRRALAAAGQMALSNYLSQTIICTTLFYGYGFGLYGRLDRPALLGIVVAIWILQLAWSPLWLSRFRFGPAEWAWRTLTYFRLPPMRRRSAG